LPRATRSTCRSSSIPHLARWQSLPTSQPRSRDPAAAKTFDALSYTNEKRHVLALESAKTAETRARRLTKAVAELRAER
jgi:hypothetical protein